MTADELRRDPAQPLPGPPEPWAETDMPSLRDGPPWHMTEMIEAEPALAVRILERLAGDGSAARLADAVREHSAAGAPVVVVGCGTSEHGAMAVATVVGEALDEAGGPTGNMQAFEASLVPMPGDGLVIAVSHEGATWATIRALEAARVAGVSTALITVSRRSPAALLADIVLETGELDQSWCHTVGYLSPIVAGIAVAAAIDGGAGIDAEVGATLAAGLEPQRVEAIDGIAAALADVERFVVVGGGADLISARELVLKIEEGTHRPAAFRHLETLLHGHLAAMDEHTGLVAICADNRAEPERARRMTQALRASRELGVRAGGILTATYAASIPDVLTPAGRVVIAEEAPNVGPAGRALLATTIPLQLLTERLARAKGVNPDPIRRDDPRYLRAAEAANPES